VPDCDFMAGRQAADLFRSHRSDPKAAALSPAAELRHVVCRRGHSR
jgi:hypothetical protein